MVKPQFEFWQLTFFFYAFGTGPHNKAQTHSDTPIFSLPITIIPGVQHHTNSQWPIQYTLGAGAAYA